MYISHIQWTKSNWNRSTYLDGTLFLSTIGVQIREVSVFWTFTRYILQYKGLLNSLFTHSIRLLLLIVGRANKKFTSMGQNEISCFGTYSFITCLKYYLSFFFFLFLLFAVFSLASDVSSCLANLSLSASTSLSCLRNRSTSESSWIAVRISGGYRIGKYGS